MGICMSKGLLIAVVLIQLSIAIFSSGTIRSLAELSAFLLITYFVFESKSRPRTTGTNRHFTTKQPLAQRNPR